ncbi:hypothetical protein ACQ4LE_005099, partial [Meloidogyne hapla]
MLPKMFDGKLAMYVHRSCNCSMEAWSFAKRKTKIQKTKQIVIGNNKCKYEKKEIVFQLSGNFSNEISLKFMPMDKSSDIKFSLNDAIVIFNGKGFIFKANDVPWNYPEYPSEIRSEIYEKEVQVKLEIFEKFINFFIISNQIYVKNTFWVPKWWKNENNMQKYANSALKIEGVIEQIVMLNVTAINKTTISLPFSTRFDKIITNNSNIIVRGFFVDTDKSKWLEINLLHDTQEADNEVGETSLTIIFECERNEKIIFKKIMTDKRYIVKNGGDCNQLIKNISSFEIYITVYRKDDMSSLFEIEINGLDTTAKNTIDSKFSVSSINWVQVKGSAKLYENPYAIFAESENNIYRHHNERLLPYESIICLEGNILPRSEISDRDGEFEINLLHEITEDNIKKSMDGDVILKIKFMFSDQLITNETKNEMIKGGKLKNKECLKSETCLLLYSCFSNDKEEDCENSIKEYINPIGRVKFTIRIYLNEKEYQIQINNGKDLINFENNIPSWAIDHVMVKGDVTDIKYGKEATTCNQPKDVHLPPNILYIDQDNRPLDGEVIIIKGTVEKEIEENDITVSFLYEALNWHEKFGKTIFRANFSKDGNTSFGSYPAPKSKRNDKNKIELKWIEF